jgi:predicted transcriptional regulator
MLHPPEYPLQGFGGKPIKPVGKVSLPVSFGDLDNARTETLTFDVVDIYHPYLAIFGRGFMNKFDAVIRQQFLCMKIPVPKRLSQCSVISKRLEIYKRATLRAKLMCIS